MEYANRSRILSKSTFFLIGVLPLSASEAKTPESNSKYTKPNFLEYKGAWFTVDYPETFKVIPSIKSNTDNAFDSVFFESPDHDIRFYICSPQWRINCSDIELQRNKEMLIADEKRNKDNKLIRLYTIKAKDSSYLRSYQVIEQSGGSVQWIIGLKYKDTNTLIKYRSQYKHFKQSVQQYAD